MLNIEMQVKMMAVRLFCFVLYHHNLILELPLIANEAVSVPAKKSNLLKSVLNACKRLQLIDYSPCLVTKLLVLHSIYACVPVSDMCMCVFALCDTWYFKDTMFILQFGEIFCSVMVV